MSRLVRVVMSEGLAELNVVAGAAGAVEAWLGPGYTTFRVHDPQEPELNILLGAELHSCRFLEGSCWTGYVSAPPSYDFECTAPEGPQWEALEELYRTCFGTRR